MSDTVTIILFTEFDWELFEKCKRLVTYWAWKVDSFELHECSNTCKQHSADTNQLSTDPLDQPSTDPLNQPSTDPLNQISFVLLNQTLFDPLQYFINTTHYFALKRAYYRDTTDLGKHTKIRQWLTDDFDDLKFSIYVANVKWHAFRQPKWIFKMDLDLSKWVLCSLVLDNVT